MNELTFDEIMSRIEDFLTNSTDEIIAYHYNQLFDTPINVVGDGLWEEEMDDYYNQETINEYQDEYDLTDEDDSDDDDEIDDDF